jgi:trk system potassium uptake protein TrkA
MRVVIVGAGHDGYYLAETLSAEGQDVIVIEADEDKAARVQDRLDVMVIAGNGASPTVLRRAGAERADLVLAVTDNDGANVMACHSTSALGPARTVARVEDAEMREVSPGLGVDVIIDARESTAREVVSLVRHAGASEYIEYAGGRLVLIGGRIGPESRVAGRRIATLKESELEWPWVLAATIRSGELLMSRGSLEMAAGDHALVMTEASHVRRSMELFGFGRKPARRALLLGGTRIAAIAAEQLIDDGLEVVIVESEVERCELLARRSRALVIHGDPTDPVVLHGIAPGKGDVVVGVSGWDEVNLMSCLVARAVGAETTIARFGKRALAGLLKDVGVDAVVSARVAAANAILRFVRRDRIVSVATFMDTDAEAIEIEVAPDSPAVGVALTESRPPRGTVICGVMRGEESFVPHGGTRIEKGDRIVVLSGREDIDAVEALFT